MPGNNDTTTPGEGSTGDSNTDSNNNESATTNNTNNTNPTSRNRQQNQQQRTTNTTGGESFANSELRDWKGMEPNIGGVLGMRVEKLTHKVSFDTFREKLEVHAMQHLRDASLAVKSVREIIDPKQSFEDNNEIADLDELNCTYVQKEMKKREVYIYFEKKERLENNMKSLYSLTWGNCTHGLQTVLKGVDGYPDAQLDFNLIWLLTAIKVIITGIDEKGKEYANL